MEGCESGRIGRSRKPLWVHAHRGFKSHSLRAPLPPRSPGRGSCSALWVRRHGAHGERRSRLSAPSSSVAQAPLPTVSSGAARRARRRGRATGASPLRCCGSRSVPRRDVSARRGEQVFQARSGAAEPPRYRCPHAKRPELYQPTLGAHRPPQTALRPGHEGANHSGPRPMRQESAGKNGPTDGPRTAAVSSIHPMSKGNGHFISSRLRAAIHA